MRYTLLLHYPEMTAEELGEEMLEQGKAAFHAGGVPARAGRPVRGLFIRVSVGKIA